MKINVNRKILEEIHDYIDRFGRAPTRSYFHECFGGMSGDVDLHLAELAREGLIQLDADEAGAIALPKTVGFVPPIQIHSSMPSHGSDNEFSTVQGPIALDLRSLGVEARVGMSGFQVLSDDMIDAGIFFGDIAIVATQQVERGDIVEVEINGCRLLRRFIVVAGIPHLLAENPLRPSLIPAYGVSIRGVLWGLIRPQISQHSADSTGSKVNYIRDEPSNLIGMYPEPVVWPPLAESTTKKGTHRSGDQRRARSSSPIGKEKSKGTASRTTKRRSYTQTGAELPPPPPQIGLNDPNMRYEVDPLP